MRNIVICFQFHSQESRRGWVPAYGQPLYTTDLAEMVAVEAVSQGDSGHWAQVSCHVITL